MPNPRTYHGLALEENRTFLCCNVLNCYTEAFDTKAEIPLCKPHTEDSAAWVAAQMPTPAPVSAQPTIAGPHRLSTFDQAVLAYVRVNPGTTMKALAAQLPVDDKMYGRQKAVASSIARLRRKGLLKDVTERCDACGCAQTRGNRNVELFVQAA